MGIGIVRTSPAVAVAAALLALTAGTEPAAAQSGEAIAERFVGGWELVDWRSTNSAGNVSFPYGEDALGQITYTANGRMSAHLMTRPEQPGEPPAQYLSYWGAFSLQLDAETVTHHVIGSTNNGFIGSDLVRGFTFEGNDRLILAAGNNRLTWRRVR